MSSHLTCHHCGSSEFETDQARGDTVCMKCGIVIEDNVIVNEIQFEEGNFGGTHVVGQRVTEEYGSHSMAVSGLMGSGKQSRQLTLENAKKKIKNVGSQLNLNSVCIDQAFGFYKMALNRRLTHGRKNTHVIAACVYMVCRLELTPHILLDLSDVMQVNVYELGKTYLKLSSSLCLNIPPIDPCIYIMRYAHRLGIKDKANEVQLTALRLVSRMKRDWMHTGRRPSGLCGAALLVSARLHGMHCSIKDVIQVVKVCETTIRKRLNEFGDTPSSKLTVDEFLSVDLEGEEDPPCYKTARKKNKTDNTNQTSSEDKQQQEKNELELKEEYNVEIEELQKKIDEAVEKSRKKLKGPFAKYAKFGESNLHTNEQDNEIENVIDENVLTRKLIEETTVETIRNVLNDNDQQKQKNSKEDSILDDLDEIDDLRPTVQSLGLNNSNNNLSQTTIEDNSKNNQNAQSTNDKDGELYFDDLDDDELESYLLNKKEIETKTSYWLKYHAEYLKEVEEKERKKQQEEELRKEREAKGEISPKKKRKSRKRTQIEANSAGEAIEKMLIEKKISNKINYDVLKRLTNELPKEEKIKEDFEDGFLSPKMESSFERGSSSFSRISSSSSALKRLPSIRSQMNLNKSSNSIINENHTTKFKSNSLKSKLLSSSKLRANKVSTNANQLDDEDLLDSPKEKMPRTEEDMLITTKKQNIEVEELEDEESEDDNDYCVEKEREELGLANFMSDNFVNNDYELADEYDEYDDYS